MIRKKIKIIWMTLGIFSFSLFFLSPVLASTDFNYQLLEGIPGIVAPGESINLNDYISGLYNFLIWAAGISALIMITVGGYMYLTSAANAAGASKAKTYITDALLGLGLVFASWLILNIINPNLTSPIGFQTTIISSVDPNFGGGSIGGGGGGCSVGVGACAPRNLAIFGNSAEVMSRICNRETGEKADKISGTDVCKDGTHFSIGLFQINLINSADSIGCGGMFNKYGGGSNGRCMPGRLIKNRYGVEYCAERDCELKPGMATKYNECLQKLLDKKTNIEVAYKLFQKGGVKPWIISAKRCGVAR